MFSAKTATCRIAWARGIAAIVIAVFAVSARATLSPPLDSVDLVATGDQIEGLGRVGFPAISVNGIDGAGRVLFSSALSDGRIALFLGDGRRIQTLWASTIEGPLLDIRAARIGESGRVLAPTASSDFGDGQVLFDVREDGLHSLVEVGETTAEGGVICIIGDFAFNETGDVAVSALSAATLDACERFEAVAAVYSLSEEAPRRIVELPDSQPGRLVGLTEDGFAVIARFFDADVFATDGTSVRTLLDAAQAEPLEFIDVKQVNDAGRVLFLAYDVQGNGAYLATDGIVRRVVSSSDTTPRGDTIAFVDDARFDATGNVIVSVTWTTANGTDAPVFDYGVLRYAPDGSSALIAPSAYQPRVNEAGQIALLRDGMGASDVIRWTGNEEVRIADGDAPAPGGAWFGEGGVNSTCVAPDGRVGVGLKVIENHEGFVCADSTGLHTLASTEDRSTFAFNVFVQCGFAGADFFFGASEGEPVESPELTVGVFRAGTNGISRVIGPGDQVSDGSSVQRLGLGYGGGLFAINERGSVAVVALTDRALAVLRRRDGAELDAPISTGTSIDASAGKDPPLRVERRPVCAEKVRVHQKGLRRAAQEVGELLVQGGVDRARALGRGDDGVGIVHPHDAEGVANAEHEALGALLEEERRRWMNDSAALEAVGGSRQVVAPAAGKALEAVLDVQVQRIAIEQWPEEAGRVGNDRRLGGEEEPFHRSVGRSPEQCQRQGTRHRRGGAAAHEARPAMGQT